MRTYIFSGLCVALLGLSACSNDSPATKTEEVHIIPAGEKATIGHLTYSIVDSQILTQLGDDQNPRVPHDRYMLLQIAVTNSSNVDNPIPAIELVSDSGKVYDELADGSGVSNWLGVIRNVGPGQTERGDVVFDAPAAHYKVRVTDEQMDKEIFADLPLSYAHEKVNDALAPATEMPDARPAQSPDKK